MKSPAASVGLILALWEGLSPGSPVALSPAEVAREFEQRTWDHEHGLPDDHVKAILQGRDGYLWIATARGLARFDGLRFTVFDHLNTPELKDDDCWSLAEDGDGNVWIGTPEALIRARDGQFTRFTELQGGRPIVAPYVTPRRAGGVWGGGRICVGWTAHNQSRVYCQAEDSPYRGLAVLEEDAQGMLWLGTYNGLVRFDVEREAFEPALAGMECEHFPAMAIHSKSNGEHWVLFAEPGQHPGLRGDKCWLTCFKDGHWIRKPDLEREDFVSGYWPSFIASDHFGGLWLPGQPNGLNRFLHEQFQFMSMPHKGAMDVAVSACCDREGNVWVGTDASGLQRWTPRRLITYTRRDGLAEDNVWTISEARDGSVLIGTDGGITRFKDGHFTNIRLAADAKENYVRSVVEDAGGTVWVGTMRTVGPIRDGTIEPLRLPGEWFETKTRVVLAARDGTVWIGAAGGLTRVQNGQYRKYTQADGFGSNDVRALLEDHNGGLWIGTLQGGLSHLHAGRFTALTKTNGLPSNTVWALHEDPDGVLWLGTDNGLGRLENGRVTIFRTSQGLPDNQVNCILEDDSGRLWITYDHGIYWVHKAQLNDIASGRAAAVRPVKYDESDGLLSTETNGQKSNPVGCKTRDGRLWFPTTKGVAVFDPGKVAADEVPPLTVIEQVRAEGKPIFDIATPAKTGEPGGATPHFAMGNVWRLPPGSGRVLEFRYTANTFVAPEKTQFKYRLLGLDEHWIEAETRREAYFTSLRPGDYRFEVIAGNLHGVWADEGAHIAVHLSPFFYQTWWFYAICAMTASASAGGIVAWRLARLRRLNRLEQQSAIAAERARIAKDLHDGLGADLSRLALLADLASGESGAAVGEHIRKLSHTSRQAARDLKELIWLANPANDTVEGLVSRISQTAEDFLHDARIRCRLDLAPRLPQDSLLLEQRRNLLLVIREALNNILKHAAATEVRLCARIHYGALYLAIEDNGRGFDPSSVPPGTLGLASMRQRVQNLGGSFQLESRPGSGTRIIIELTLPPSTPDATRE